MIDPTGQAANTGQSDPTRVSDGGVARTVVGLRFASFAATTTLVGATAGLKTKVLGVHFAITPVTTAGAVYLKDGGGTLLLVIDNPYPTTPASYFTRTVAMSGYVICETPVNSALVMQVDATPVNYNVQLQYYQAP